MCEPGLAGRVARRASRRALALAGLPGDLRARHMARLVHNLVSAGRPQDARKLLGQARHAVRSAGDPDANFTLAVSEALLDYASGSFGPALERIEAVNRRRSELARAGTRATGIPVVDGSARRPRPL